MLKAIRAYAASSDPLVRAGNTVALVLAGNQPFYPLYLIGLFGHVALPSLVQVALTPVCGIVPWLARRMPLAARIWLVLVGTGNTIIYLKIVGQPSGLELFFVPCTALAALLFRQGERWIMVPLTALPVVVFLGLHGRYGVPLIPFSAASYHTMVIMNAISVATLLGFFAILFVGMRARTPVEKEIG